MPSSTQHTIHGHHHHFGWDNSNTPVLTIAPGESIGFEIVDASGGQLTVNSTVTDVPGLDFGKVNPVTGPVFVDGAEPGDALSEGDDLLEITTDKAAFCVPVPQNGRLVETRVAEDDVVHVGDVICILEVNE